MVLTTDLLPAAPASADVVTGEPLLKLGEPLMKPEIEPSGFCFHLEMVGTPRGAVAAFATLSVGVFALALGAAAAVTGVSVVPFGEPPIPNRENVGRPLTGGTSMGVSLTTGAFFATGFLATGFFGAAFLGMDATFGAAFFTGFASSFCCWSKILCNVNCPESAPLDGLGGAFFAATGCFFTTGAFSFFTTGAFSFFAGLLNAAVAASAARPISASRAFLALRSSSCCLSNSVTAGLSLAMKSLRAASVNMYGSFFFFFFLGGAFGASVVALGGAEAAGLGISTLGSDTFGNEILGAAACCFLAAGGGGVAFLGGGGVCFLGVSTLGNVNDGISNF